MTTLPTLDTSTDLVEGQRVAQFGAHVGHGTMTFTGLNNGYESVRCSGCGETVFRRSERYVQSERRLHIALMELLCHQLVADGVLVADEPIARAAPRLVDNVGLTQFAEQYGYRLALEAANRWERDPYARATLLADVRREAADAAGARQDLEEAIRRAVKSGTSLRDVAVAAGVSHEQVRRIAAR